MTDTDTSHEYSRDANRHGWTCKYCGRLHHDLPGKVGLHPTDHSTCPRRFSDLTEREYATLVGCPTTYEWAAACGRIKGSRGGNYPEDWHERVVKPGLMRMIGLDGSMEVSTR